MLAPINPKHTFHMKKTFIILCFIPIVSFCQVQNILFDAKILESPIENATKLTAPFNYLEIPVYELPVNKKYVVLNNDYEEIKIKNGDNWLNIKSSCKPVQIDFVFTKYPQDINKWQTNYYEFISKRLKALFAVDPLLNSSTIQWRIILQTAGVTQKEADKLFHGFVIVYQDIEAETKKIDTTFTARTTISSFVPQTKEQKEAFQFIQNQGGITDTTVMDVFFRHLEWKNSLVVMDWTGSMYQFGGQAIMWHLINMQNSGIKYFAFFNDGDATPETEKIIGETGGIYFSEAQNMEQVIKLMDSVQRRGNGGDIPENNFEAIIKAIAKFPKFDNLILIADNNACVKDFVLLDKIKVPVKVILCGYSVDRGINTHYLQLALKTKGSIHTIEDDIIDLVIGEGKHITGKDHRGKIVDFSTSIIECDKQLQEEEDQTYKVSDIQRNLRLHPIKNFKTKYLGLPKTVNNQTTYSQRLLMKPDAKVNSVYILDLRGNALTTLPQRMFDCKNLRCLTLQNNNLESLPTEIADFKTLQYLNVQNNKLKTVAPEIGNLPYLQYLILNGNELREIPKEIGNLSKLEELDLSSNQLSSLPEEIQLLKNLKILDLRLNNFSETEKTNIQNMFKTIEIRF